MTRQATWIVAWLSRRERQSRVIDDHSLVLWAILGEGVVRQIVGSPSVTAAQLRFLAEASYLPNERVWYGIG